MARREKIIAVYERDLRPIRVTSVLGEIRTSLGFSGYSRWLAKENQSTQTRPGAVSIYIYAHEIFFLRAENSSGGLVCASELTMGGRCFYATRIELQQQN